MTSPFPHRPQTRRIALFVCSCLGFTSLAHGQSTASSATATSAPSTGSPSADANAQPELAGKIDRLTKSLEQTQVELAESRTEIQQLRTTLQQVLDRINAAPPAAVSASAQNSYTPAPSDTSTITAAQTKSDDSHAAPAKISQDDWDVLNARVDEQRQTKVESGSRFRLKLSGLALFTAFAGFGQVDNVELPGIAVPKFYGYSGGNVGASVRQSIVGLTGIGPTVFGARTSADVQMDFFGGTPNSYGATSAGLAEVRLARLRLDWKDTSVVAGLDYPFFSPNLPTSYMSVVVPGFASAGNLWNWTPTIRVEHRFDGPLAAFKVEAGFLDPSSGIYNSANANPRIVSPTQNSRQPTYAVRVSASTKSEDRPTTIGFSGVYSPQRFVFGYTVAGWAGTIDWRFPLLPHTELNGEFFTGRGIDGFGGVPLSPLRPADAFQYASVTAPELANLGVIGGWSQFKVKVNARNEFNIAAGTGGRKSDDLRQLAANNYFISTVPARNQMMFVNYVFRPRSDLLFSAEYRRLRTYEVNGAPNTAGQLGLAMGFLF
jgi:hypothetical protein